MNNFVRIISGQYKNTVLSTPKSGTHPMGEREKNALFNMIADYIADARVLDLFAGSGALGFEAISRGAASVTFVEKSAAAMKIIRQNAAKLGENVVKNTTFVQTDVANFPTNQTFDVILVDPPYDQFDPQKLQNLPKLLNKTGILVLSHPKTVAAPNLSKLKNIDNRTYANAQISFYARDDNPSSATPPDRSSHCAHQ